MNDHDLTPLPTLEPGLYRHVKGGEYEVIEVARHSETYEPVVVYRALYGRRELWVRPFAMFTEIVQTASGAKQRFTRVESPRPTD
jgi:hypothetical protein